jgi:hypothetical protein
LSSASVTEAHWPPWAAYFPYGRIAGVDLELPPIALDERVRMYAGNQADTAILSRAAAEVAPDGFDIIIDDCSHIGALAKASFWHLFDHHLKPGTLYVIEDWATGFWPDWPDGRSHVREPDGETRMPSHDAGMVEFVKQLVDELQVAPIRGSILLDAGMCEIRKAV